MTEHSPQLDPDNTSQPNGNASSSAARATKGLHVALMNAQSVRNKCHIINEYIGDHCDDSIDLLAITKTWPDKDSDAAVMNDLVNDGYSLISVPRGKGRGDGVGLVHRDLLSCRLMPNKHNKHMELMHVRVQVANITFDSYVLYHPPVSCKISSIADFLGELEALLADVAVSVVPTIVMGDFNIHYDESTQSGKLIDIIDSFNMLQHVGDPAHSCGRIPDLVVNRASDQLVSSVAVKPITIGTHHSVDCVLASLRPSAVPTRVQVLNFKRIDLDQFQRDVGRHTAELTQFGQFKQLSELSEAYVHDCKAVLDKHAPLKTVVRKSQPKSWYNDDVDQMREK